MVTAICALAIPQKEVFISHSSILLRFAELKVILNKKINKNIFTKLTQSSHE